MPIDFIRDCTHVLYKQLIGTGFGCYPSYFTLCRDFLSMRIQILGEPRHTSSIASQQFTKPPLLQESRLTGGSSPNLVGLVERKAV